jgi:tetratricopeptide (TPR) repeat protein
MSPKNPYIAGDPVGNGNTFVGRTDVLQQVLNVVSNPTTNAIVLYGQRRIGKTSVLQQLLVELPNKGAYHPILFDLHEKAQWTVKQVLQELAQAISDKLEKSTPDLKINSETTFRLWLSELLNNLQDDDSSLVLLLDEFDVLANPDSEQAIKTFFPYLRELLSTHIRHLNCVFVMGRKVDDLSNIALTLFKEKPAKKISLLDQDSTVELIRLSEKNSTLNWSNEAINKILQLTSGHPYLTQHLCMHVWNRLCYQNPAQQPTATLQDVETVIPDTLEASRNILEWLWDALPPAERIVASAIAKAHTEVITKTQLDQFLNENGVRQIVRELHEAPKLLKEWDLIKEPVAESYCFQVELLRCWVEEYKPLHQAQEELDRINPAADSLYKTARQLYQDHHIKEAKDTVRLAIQSKSDHIGANLLLADILIEQKQFKEVIEILEKHHEYSPARHRLISALLALAQSSQSKKEQRKRYQRILELEPEHSEAKKQLKKIPKRWQMAKPRQWATNITGFFNNQYAKITLDVLVFISALLISYYLFGDKIPKQPVIILEVGQSANDVSEYTITGVVSDKPYLLDTVKILPHCEHPVKQATFKYDIYTQAVDLKVNSNTQPPTYWIDKTSLQQTLAENDNHFSFKFLEKERFTFDFQFDAPKTTQAEFECQVFTADNHKVPCQVREKGWLSLFRGIPWIVIGSILAIILIVMIERIYAFKKRKHNVGYQKY